MKNCSNCKHKTLSIYDSLKCNNCWFNADLPLWEETNNKEYKLKTSNINLEKVVLSDGDIFNCKGRKMIVGKKYFKYLLRDNIWGLEYKHELNVLERCEVWNNREKESKFWLRYVEITKEEFIELRKEIIEANKEYFG